MTTPDTKAIRAQMEALSGFAPGPWKVSPTDDTNVITHDREMVAEIAGDYNDPDLWPIMEADTRLIAAAPDMRETILAICAALDAAQAEIERLQTIIGNLHTVEEKHRETANVHFHRANSLDAENERLRGALSNIIHTFTERSDGSLVTFPGGYYQAMACAALAAMEADHDR